MKYFLKVLIFMIMVSLPVFSAQDKTSYEYLTSKKHISVVSPFAQKIVEKSIVHSLKKETKGRYKVKFKGYTLAGLKKGIFKYLEVTGKNITINDIEIPYYNVRTVSDYNWVDYNQHPIAFKSDIELDFIAHFSENSINDALQKEEYLKTLRKVNKYAYPMFTLNEVKVRIKNNKVYVIMSYNLPLAPKAKDRTFMVQSNLKVSNNMIMSSNIQFDTAYGNLPLNKVTNLLNLLNPLNFAVKLTDTKKGECKISDVKIEDDIVIINGKMYIKGEK